MNSSSWLTKPRFASLFAFASLFILVGCKMGSLIERTAPDTVRDAKSYYELLRTRQTPAILQAFDPSIDKDQLAGQLVKVYRLVPQEPPLNVETLGASVECKATGICTKLVILEYKYSDRWVLLRATTNNANGRFVLVDLNVTPESLPVESINRFTLQGTGWMHFAILFAVLLCTGVVIHALIVCIRTPMEKRKWLWIILTILGLGKFGINWATGELWFRIAYISVLPLGWGYATDGPFLYFSIPVGAILFVALRNRLRKVDAPSTPFDRCS